MNNTLNEIKMEPLKTELNGVLKNKSKNGKSIVVSAKVNDYRKVFSGAFSKILSVKFRGFFMTMQSF
jgi:hypothetical protein